MKWINNGVAYKRGCYESLIAKFDDTPVWFTTNAIQTQQSMKFNFKRLGELFEANKCEVKPMYNESDEWTEENIVVFDFMYSGECKFYHLNEDGSMVLINIEEAETV